MKLNVIQTFRVMSESWALLQLLKSQSSDMTEDENADNQKQYMTVFHLLLASLTTVEFLAKLG